VRAGFRRARGLSDRSENRPLIHGYRNSRVNSLVGGVPNSQHLIGQAADIRPQDPAQLQRLVAFLKSCEHTDQLLTASTWLHVSWNPFAPPRRFVRIGYYK
jgi:putative chitinase